MLNKENQNASMESIRAFMKIKILLRKAYEYFGKPKCFYEKLTSIEENRNASTGNVRAFRKTEMLLWKAYEHLGKSKCL